MYPLVRLEMCLVVRSGAPDTQQTHYAIMTSLLRQNDVIWRRFDAIMTLLLRHVFRGYVPISLHHYGDCRRRQTLVIGNYHTNSTGTTDCLSLISENIALQANEIYLRGMDTPSVLKWW